MLLSTVLSFNRKKDQTKGLEGGQGWAWWQCVGGVREVGDLFPKNKKVFQWKNKQKNKQKLVSAQDEAGLATGWVSSAAGGGIGTSRGGRGLWCVVLLLLLLLLPFHVFRIIYGCSNKRSLWLASLKSDVKSSRSSTSPWKRRVLCCSNRPATFKQQYFTSFRVRE